MSVRLTVVGSVNLDLVASGSSLPCPGQTVTGAVLARHPGGKGANQALAARRLGAEVRLVARVGADPFAEEALALLRADGVDLSGCRAVADAPTGVALICVSADGENQISVAPGANLALTPDDLPDLGGEAVLLQLETPRATVEATVRKARGFVALNLAPAAEIGRETLERADLIIVNEGEAAFYGDMLALLPGLLAVTLGARGAQLFRAGELIAEASPPPVAAIDTTGAGDCFCGYLAAGLTRGDTIERAAAEANAAASIAVQSFGAAASIPDRATVLQCLGSTPVDTHKNIDKGA